MTSPIQGLISPTTGLFPALRQIVGRSEQDDGILRIEDNDKITGDVALSQSRYITGAYESSTGTSGVQALTKLLAVRKGSFKFIPISNGFDANLQQTLKLDVKKLVSDDESEDAAEESESAADKAESAANQTTESTIGSVARKPKKEPGSSPEVTRDSTVAAAASAGDRAIMIPQFSTDATERQREGDLDRDKQIPAAGNEKTTAMPLPLALPQAKKPAAIHVSQTKADMDGQFVYADMEKEDDLFSLLEHFGLSLEQPIVERLYENDPANVPANRRGPTADIVRRAAARLNSPAEATQVAANHPSPAPASAKPPAIDPSPIAETPQLGVDPQRAKETESAIRPEAQVREAPATESARLPEPAKPVPAPESRAHEPISVPVEEAQPGPAAESATLAEQAPPAPAAESAPAAEKQAPPPVPAAESTTPPEVQAPLASADASTTLPEEQAPLASADESTTPPEEQVPPAPAAESSTLPEEQAPPAPAAESSTPPEEQAPPVPTAESATLPEEQAPPTPAIESAPPYAGTAAAEGAEVGTWAARVLSGQEGEGKPLVQIESTVVSPAATSAPTPTSSGQVLNQTGQGTTSDTAPSSEETWTERVIAAARKAKGNVTSDNTITTNAAKITANKIDVDQSASMRLKFHGKAPQPNLPDRLQKGTSTFWTKHRVKLISACVLIGILTTAFVLERSILSLIYTRKAEERIETANYGAAMNDIGIALFFDPGQEAAHYAKARVFSKLGQEANALAEYNVVLASNPTRLDALERRAALCVTLGDFRQTLDDCNQLVSLQPKKCSPYVFANRGIANYMLGNRDEAVKDFTAALKLKGKDEALLTRRGATYSLLGQVDNAVKDYDAAIKLYPKSAEAYAGRAQCWLRAKKFSNAFADFDRAVKLSPINAALLTQRGASYAITKQYDRADKDFAKALAINPRYAGAYRERARISILQHQYGPAEADLRRAAQVKTPDSDFYKQRAELYELMDNHAKARDDYSDALSLQPNDIESFIGRARNLSSLGNQRAAMADIDEALKLAPTYSQLFALRGLFGDRYGNTSTAKTDFDKAIELAPGNAEAHLWRGDFLLKQKDFISASDDFDQALKLNPDLVEARQNKILAQAKLPHSTARLPLPLVTHSHPNKEDQELLDKGTLPELVQAGYAQMRSGNNERAVVLLERAVRVNPNDASARRYLAHTFLATGDTDNAIAQFQMVDKLGKPNADDIKALADALAQTSRKEEAIAAYNRCLQMRPDDVQSRCSLARLYEAAGFLNKAREVCLEGMKNSSTSADLNAVLKEIQNKATRQPNTTAPTQEQRPNTEG
jgi:tetratricopeptide (TPR) repeat protein